MDIKQALESDEGKKAIKEAVDAATAGLIAKRDELLAENKKFKNETKSLQDQIDEIKAKADEAEAAAAAKTGDVEKVKTQLEAKHKKEIDALTAQLTEKDGKLNNLLIDGGITEALSKANVAPQFMEAARALLKGRKAEIADQNGTLVAMLDGKPINEFVSQWSQSDQGKHFVAAQTNGGGGANGSNGSGKAAAGKTITRAAFDALDPAAKQDHTRSGGRISD